MDCFISHHNPLKYESVFFEFIFTFLRLKKVPWIALLSTANFEQVIIISHFANFEQVKKHSSHFATDFEQVIIKIVILLTLNKL